MKKENTIAKWGRVSDTSEDSEIEQVRQVETVGGKPKPTYIVLPPGYCANVPVDSTVIMVSPGGSGQDQAGIPAMPENRFAGLKLNEVKVGNLKSRAHVFFSNDGNIHMSTTDDEATDWAVQFTAMQSAFNQLKSDFDSLVTAYNMHIHQVAAMPSVGTPPPTIPTVPTTSTGTPSTADMSGAKVEKVRLP